MTWNSPQPGEVYRRGGWTYRVTAVGFGLVGADKRRDGRKMWEGGTATIDVWRRSMAGAKPINAKRKRGGK